jgi:carboxylate-amine ligase
LAQTAGEPLRSLSGEYTPAPLLAGYASPAYDEALLSDGRVRAAHAEPIRALSRLSAFALRDHRLAFDREKQAAAVEFRSTDSRRGGEFAIDFVPRVLTGEEWSRIQGGTAQRARALDAFLNDIYGEGAIVRDGILPAWIALRSPGFRSEARELPRTLRRAHVSGFDIVRDADGRWLVLEDNVRVPSGVGYAVENRRLLRAAFPELFEGVELLEPNEAPALLRRMLEESAPSRAPDTPRLALLSEGPTDSAWFEHRTLAAAMDMPLVTPRELQVEDGTLLRLGEAGRREAIDVLYLRMEDALRHVDGSGRALGPGLIRAVKSERLVLANALGNGIADDKSVYAFVPKFIEYYLGERPLFEQVPTYDCADPDQRAHVLSHLGELVIKPVDGYGGFGVVIGPSASDEELARARELIVEQPSRWIAQDMILFSTHPTYERGKLRARHVDLRVFVYYGRSPVVVPAALTRVAPEGSMIVNSSRGGGAKDTWILQ